MKKREGTSFVKTLPKGSGSIVAMLEFSGRLYIASEKGIWYLSDAKTRFVRCRFSKQLPQGDRMENTSPKGKKG